MADSTNPVSPKAVWAGIGGAIGAVIGPVVLEIIDQVLLLPNIPDVWKFVLTAVVTILGAVIGAYRKTDGLRIPTLDQAQVDKLELPEEDSVTG